MSLAQTVPSKSCREINRPIYIEVLLHFSSDNLGKYIYTCMHTCMHTYEHACMQTKVTKRQNWTRPSSPIPPSPHHQVPVSLNQHLATLRELGTRDAATGADLLALLEGARRSLGGAPLNINETRALLRLLCTLCDGHDAELTRAARAAAAEGKVWPLKKYEIAQGYVVYP